jgi:hypothetical protein
LLFTIFLVLFAAHNMLVCFFVVFEYEKMPPRYRSFCADCVGNILCVTIISRLEEVITELHVTLSVTNDALVRCCFCPAPIMSHAAVAGQHSPVRKYDFTWSSVWKWPYGLTINYIIKFRWRDESAR